MRAAQHGAARHGAVCAVQHKVARTMVVDTNKCRTGRKHHWVLTRMVQPMLLAPVGPYGLMPEWHHAWSKQWVRPRGKHGDGEYCGGAYIKADVTSYMWVWAGGDWVGVG